MEAITLKQAIRSMPMDIFMSSIRAANAVTQVLRTAADLQSMQTEGNHTPVLVACVFSVVMAFRGAGRSDTEILEFVQFVINISNKSLAKLPIDKWREEEPLS